MNKTVAKLILLDYNNWEYVKEFKGCRIDDKFCVNIHDIYKLTRIIYKLQIHNYNSIVFYMNLLNFGGFCDWKVIDTEILLCKCDDPIQPLGSKIFLQPMFITSIEIIPSYFNWLRLFSVKDVTFYRDL